MSVNSASSQSSSGANGAGQSQQSQGGDQGGGEEKLDVHALLDEHRSAIEQQFGGVVGQSQKELNALKAENAKTKDVLDGIRKAITGETDDKAAVDPFQTKIDHYTNLIDSYLSAAVDAERQGKPIPLTVKNAIESFTGHIEQLKLNQTMARELDEIKKKVGKATNPSHAIDQQAFSAMDSQIINGLNTVYGEGEEMEDVRAAQFRSVAGMITEEVKRLQGEDPQLWDRIRRNPSDQKKLVNHFIQKSIPPRAKQLMDAETVRNTVLTKQDLFQAWDEAKSIKDPEEKARVQHKLRLQILEETVMGKKSGGVNQLYRGQ